MLKTNHLVATTLEGEGGLTSIETQEVNISGEEVMES